MSTKIYTAYRTRTGVDLWALLKQIRRRAEKNVKAALWTLYPTVDDSPGKAFREIYDNYLKQFGQYSKNEWDITVDIAIWKSGRHYLMIPFAGSGHLKHVLDFMKRCPELQDYSYWNNSDRPKHITEQAWRARKRAWGKVIADSGWDDHLTLSIVSVHGFHRVNPIWAPEYRDKLKRLRNE